MPYLGIFGLEFQKSIVIFEISTLEFSRFKNESLTHTMKFGVGFAFCKGSGFAFSEGPGPGPGPLYKVCRLIFFKSRHYSQLQKLSQNGNAFYNSRFKT